MSTPTHPSLADVLQRYAAAGPGPDTLAEWTARHPGYRDELADFTQRWDAFQQTPPDEPSDTDPYVALGVQTVEEIIAGLSYEPPPVASSNGTVNGSAQQASADEDAAVSFNVILDECGTTLPELSARSGLDLSVLLNLASGGFSFSSADEQRRVMKRLAAHACAPSDPSDHIIHLLTQCAARPRRFAGAHKANTKPEAITKDFFDGIRDAKRMTDEARADWLALRDDAQ